MEDHEIVLGIMLGVIEIAGPNAAIVHDHRRRVSHMRIGVKTMQGHIIVIEHCFN